MHSDDTFDGLARAARRGDWEAAFILGCAVVSFPLWAPVYVLGRLAAAIRRGDI